MDKTDIQNLAIVLIGAKTVVSDTDDTKAAKLAGLLWETAYKGMLELPHNWNFATTRKDITGNLTTTPTVGHYDYRYKLPKYCLRVIAQIDKYDDTLEYEHRIENFLDSDNKTHPVLVTDQDECFIKFIMDLGQGYEIQRWPSWFARIVALDLALIMCEPLKQDKQKVNQLEVKMHATGVGWMARAIQANGFSGMDTTDDDDNTDKGNNSVLNASHALAVSKQYIIQRE